MTVTLERPAGPADALATFELPQFVRLRSGVVAACFPLMKLLVAHRMIDHAIGTGRIGPRTRVMETTSGTLGLGLAMVCARYGLPLTLVTDPVVDEPFRNKLEALGAEVDIVAEPAAEGGYQRSRLDRLAMRAAAEPDSFVPDQYRNPQNPAAYAVVADLIAQHVGPVDRLVGCVGSGGSMCGISAGLRRHQADVHTVGVDTHGSVLFGHHDTKRTLRGLGNSLQPGNVRHRAFDDVHWVNGEEAVAATLGLYRDEALFRGPTSGAAALVAGWEQEQHPGERVVVVLADEGERYLDTVYNPQWRAAQGYSEGHPPAPTEVPTPERAQELGTWSRLNWNRREWST